MLEVILFVLMMAGLVIGIPVIIALIFSKSIDAERRRISSLPPEMKEMVRQNLVNMAHRERLFWTDKIFYDRNKHD